MKFNLIFDAKAQSAPQSFRDGIQAAASLLSNTFYNPITLNVIIGYGEYPGDGSPETNGGASAFPATSSLLGVNYSQLLSWLATSEDSAVQSAVAALPVKAPMANDIVCILTPQIKLLGLTSGNDPQVDGYAGFATDINPDVLEGVAIHELTHAMGRAGLPGYMYPTLFDLFRFTGVNTRLLSGGSVPSYLSLDNGNTKIADYGQISDPTDFLNNTLNDPLDEFYNPATVQRLTPIDILQMEVLGYNVTPPAIVNVHANNLAYSMSAQSPTHFIDLVNFEASYNDLVSAFGNNQTAMQSWYQTNQPVEHRISLFDGLDYVASYQDLIKAFGSNSQQHIMDAGASHYINFGMNEHRTTVFNALDYVAGNSDLITSIGVNADAAAMQFIQVGSAQGRTTSFDGLDYIASYRDLIDAFGANEQAGAAHFITSGYHEGRVTTFDGLAYIANYTDLMTALGANNDLGAAHYINNGLNEGRSTTFDVKAYEATHADLKGMFTTDDQFLNAYINTYVKTGNLLV